MDDSPLLSIIHRFFIVVVPSDNVFLMLEVKLQQGEGQVVEIAFRKTKVQIVAYTCCFKMGVRVIRIQSFHPPCHQAITRLPTEIECYYDI